MKEIRTYANYLDMQKQRKEFAKYAQILRLQLASAEGIISEIDIELNAYEHRSVTQTPLWDDKPP